MPNMFKVTPEGLCNPRHAGKSTLVSLDSPRGDTAATPDNPVGTGGRSICRALDSENRAQEGRAQGKCMVYAPLLDHVETDLDFALRVFPRTVGDGELDASLSGPAGFLGSALNPSARGQPLNAAIFGYLANARVWCFYPRQQAHARTFLCLFGRAAAAILVFTWPCNS